MPHQALSVSTPGKLILMGEHAAVYGRPALVAAIDLRLRASFLPAAAPPGTVWIDLPQLGVAETTGWQALCSYAAAARAAWQSYVQRPTSDRFSRVRGTDSSHVVRVALGEAMSAALAAAGRGGSPDLLRDQAEGELRGTAQGTALPALHLRVESDLPIGSGFGSSAAAAVATVAGFQAWCGGELEAATISPLALEVERRQHGLPSGIDTATSLHGGFLWARKLPSGALDSQPVAPRSPLLGCLRVYDTGAPAESTGAVVAAVKEGSELHPARHESLLERMESATTGFHAALLDPSTGASEVFPLVRDYQRCLEQIGVVPEAVRALVRRVEGEGGAAKISGAGSLGGPGAGSLLVFHPEPGRVESWDFLRPFRFHPLRLGAAGLRRESAQS